PQQTTVQMVSKSGSIPMVSPVPRSTSNYGVQMMPLSFVMKSFTSSPLDRDEADRVCGFSAREAEDSGRVAHPTQHQSGSVRCSSLVIGQRSSASLLLALSLTISTKEHRDVIQMPVLRQHSVPALGYDWAVCSDHTHSQQSGADDQ